MSQFVFAKPKPGVSSLQESHDCKKRTKRVENKGRKGEYDPKENQYRNFNIKIHFKIKT